MTSVLSETDYKLLRSIVKMSQDRLQRTMKDYLSKKYSKVVYDDKFIYAEGEIPIALVAHMDTVFKTPPSSIYYDDKQGVLWSPDGLGADDRAGILAILKIIQSGLRPSVILTTDEEIGGKGADAFIKKFPDAPTDIRYIIQLDRRGTTDCVFYDCDNRNFVEYVESFGFIENFGSFSDISVICPAWGIAGVNLSIGYEDEHSYSETLHINPWFKTIQKVERMLRAGDIPKFIYIPSKYSYAVTPVHDMSMYYEDTSYCDGCHGMFLDSDLMVVRTADGSYSQYCIDCCVNHVSWCIRCGDAFEVKNGEAKCPRCYGGSNSWKSVTEKYKNSSTK